MRADTGEEDASNGCRQRRVPSLGQLVQFRESRSGATAIEYGLIASLISAALIAGMTPLGGAIKNTFATVTNTLLNAN